MIICKRSAPSGGGIYQGDRGDGTKEEKEETEEKKEEKKLLHADGSKNQR